MLTQQEIELLHKLVSEEIETEKAVAKDFPEEVDLDYQDELVELRIKLAELHVGVIRG